MHAGGPGSVQRRVGLSRENTQQRRLRRFVFTINNYTAVELENLKQFAEASCRWMIAGKEKAPETGTIHLQGGCILNSQICFSTLKKSPCFARAHIESMYGRPEDTRSYCSKEDSEPYEWGTLPTPGKRNDLHSAVSFLRDGNNLEDMANVDEHGPTVVKFYKGLTIFRSLIRKQRVHPPEVYWFHGQTGFGKTRAALAVGDKYADRPNDIWLSSNGLKWFDGYDGQSISIIDDLRGEDVPSFPFLLRLLDRYPVRCEFKGGSVQWTPHTIIITSAFSPRDCFYNRYRGEDLAQLERRLTYIHHFEEPINDSEGIRLLLLHIDSNIRRKPGDGGVGTDEGL